MNSEERANRITDLHKIIGFNDSQLELEQAPLESRRNLELETAKLVQGLKVLQSTELS